VRGKQGGLEGEVEQKGGEPDRAVERHPELVRDPGWIGENQNHDYEREVAPGERMLEQCEQFRGAEIEGLECRRAQVKFRVEEIRHSLTALV